MQKEYSAGVVVFRIEDNVRQYLLLHYASGHWDFPKGHIEKGEEKKEAALRELYEEAGIRAQLVPDWEYAFDYFFKNIKTGELVNKTVYFFIGKTDEKKITLSHEHQGYAWLSYEQALEKITYKNAQELLSQVDSYLNS
jgi:8-oxo-dGTP pyrophosphatase MutT (NUDIX family)